MDSIASSSLSVKQVALLSVFQGLANQLGIKLEINPQHYELESPVSIDVEHDEAGGLVGIGAYDGKRSYYWTTPLVGSWIEIAELIAHNGLGDLDCLRLWGINVTDSQLVWDSMLMGHINDSSLKAYGLKDMAKRDLGIEYPDYDEIVGAHKRKTKKAAACPRLRSDCCGRITLDKQPVLLTALYNALDCYTTWHIAKKQGFNAIDKL